MGVASIGGSGEKGMSVLVGRWGGGGCNYLYVITYLSPEMYAGESAVRLVVPH